MSDSYFVFRMAALERQLQSAKEAHDAPLMHSTLGEMTSLLRAYYGAPQGTH